MRRLITAFISAFMLISLLPSSGFSERGIQIQERRLALIVGNGAYKSSPLRNPVNDAHDIADILRKLGFEVIYKENAGQRVMEKAIREFGKRLRKGGVGLFYFSGHGMQVNGRNYLIPVGARIHQETDMKYEAVDAGRVLDEMYNAGNNFNIVILDACRDNPFARSFRSSSRGLAQMDAPTGSLIVYATAPGSVAADGTGRNGIFTKHLLSHIETPGLDIELMLRSVRAGVNDETQGKQMPWSSSSLRGDFSFNPLATPHEGSATIISSVPKPTEKGIYERPAKPKRGPDDVEIAELSENGLLYLVITATGTSSSEDAISRRVFATKSAVSKARSTMISELAERPYNMTKVQILELCNKAKIIRTRYLDDGKKVEIKYKVLLPGNLKKDNLRNTQ